MPIVSIISWYPIGATGNCPKPLSIALVQDDNQLGGLKRTFPPACGNGPPSILLYTIPSFLEKMNSEGSMISMSSLGSNAFILMLVDFSWHISGFLQRR